MIKIKYFVLFYILLINTNTLFAIIYENAEDKKNNKWSVIKSYAKGKIENIYDKEKKSRVIQFKGEGTKSTYVLKMKKKSNKNHILSWEMNYREDFVIMVELNTSQGNQSLIYTAGNDDSYLQYGLGETAILGLWKKFERNLMDDLENAIGDAEIFNVNNFVIKGSGRIDNIQLTNTQSISPKNIPTSKTVVNKSSNIKTANKTKNRMPRIYLKGKNPLFLEKGESYVEAGAKAIDYNGKSLNVEISHQIDTLTEGLYLVIYMTSNHLGNSVIETRRVVVGELNEQKKNKEKDEVFSEEALNLDRRAKELYIWEEELKEREKTLSVNKRMREKFINKPPEGYP